MTGSSGNAKEIDLGNGFGDVAVKANGIRVEMHADGSVAAYTQKDVDAYTNGAVHVHPAASDSWTIRDKDKIVGEGRIVEVTGAEPKPGDRMQDGTVYAGISDNGKPMYATLKDAPLIYTFKQAQQYAAKLDAHGHKDWRVPTQRELNVLWQNRDKGALQGTFNVTGASSAGWYWSSSQGNDDDAWAQCFGYRLQGFTNEFLDASLRCVR